MKERNTEIAAQQPRVPFFWTPLTANSAVLHARELGTKVIIQAQSIVVRESIWNDRGNKGKIKLMLSSS